MNNRHFNSNHHHASGPDPRDWRMTFKCYKQNVGKVYDQFTDLLAKLKKGREMLKTGNTGVNKERPTGMFGIEKLRNTGRVVLEVVDEKDVRIGQPTVICASGKRKKFVNDERTGMAVPANEQDDLLWEESMNLAINVVAGALRYVEMGRMIDRARKAWDNEATITPLASALCTSLGALNLEGDGEEIGFLREFLLSLVWPAVNGRTFSNLDEGFSQKSVASADGELLGGCWIYTWAPLVIERSAELQTKALADMEHAAAQKDITKAERKAMLAVAHATPVSQPEAVPADLTPTVEAVAVPQDAQAS